MNIVNRLTLRHMKGNKRRTLVTIIGVIISVAMLTAVATIVTSFMALLQKNEIESGGEWHVRYKDVNTAQLAAVQNDKASKAVVISKDHGYAMLEGSQNRYKPYLFIKAYNTEGFSRFPVELAAGRLPKAADEIVISEAIETNAKVKIEIGDTLDVQVGERFSTDPDSPSEPLDQNWSLQLGEEDELLEELRGSTAATYTVVGIIKRPSWEPTWAPGYTVISYIDESFIGENETVHASVVLKKVRRSLYDHAKMLADREQIESVQFNSNLLRYYGLTANDGFQRTLYSLSAIIMGIIMVGSVTLIYNAFAISVSERSRHLGMLSSVGATRKQLRNSVFFEGFVIGLISIPIGIVCGLVGIGITFMYINSLFQSMLGTFADLTVVVTPFSVLVACAVSVLTILISTYYPAIKASRISAIDAIRQATDVKLTRRAVKTSGLVRKLFGIEAEIGLKNLKRNKRRYQATVISLVISIILFLSVSFFTANLRKTADMTRDGINYDMSVAIVNVDSDTSAVNNSSEDERAKQIISQITALEDVTEFNVVRSLDVNIGLDEAYVPEDLRGWIYAEDGNYVLRASFYALTDESLQAYADEIGADYNQLTNEEQWSAILIDQLVYQDYEQGKYVETKAIHAQAGQVLPLEALLQEWEETGDAYVVQEKHLGQVEIAALTTGAELPMGIEPAGIGDVKFIVSERMFQQLEENEWLNASNARLYLNSDNPLKTQQEIEELYDYLYVYNIYQFKQSEQQTITIISVFTYGFIILITAISIANIFNTISTSIALRKREFAMLKSIGMTPQSFNKMINYESLFYGMKSLLYGLPLSFVAMYLIHWSLMNSFSFSFVFPWQSILIVIFTVFLIVGSSMLYSSAKVKKENIIDALKQENI